MTERATGTFEVKIAPEAVPGKASDPLLGQMAIDKVFQGDLEGISIGSMLTAGTATKGSAGYVAIEKVTGTLKGHKGSFILQHTATMNRGEPSMSITVVPDSGTGELASLSGKLGIRIEGGKHFYDFDYALAAKS